MVVPGQPHPPPPCAPYVAPAFLYVPPIPPLTTACCPVCVCAAPVQFIAAAMLEAFAEELAEAKQAAEAVTQVRARLDYGIVNHLTAFHPLPD